MRILLGLSLLLLLAACYEPAEGCLNRRAANFDLDADFACGGCCTFPQVSLRFESVWPTPDGDRLFSPDSIYYDATGQPFRLRRLRFYWSEVALLRLGADPLPILDSIDVRIANGTDTTALRLRDDVVLADIDRTPRIAVVGTVEAGGTMAALYARLGIADPLNRAVTTSVSPETHPLAPQLGGMNLGAATGYVFVKVEFFEGISPADTVVRTINLYGAEFLRDLTLPLPSAMVLPDGFNTTVVIRNDLSQWFAGINVRNPDTTALKQQFVTNSTQSFTVSAITRE